MSKFEDTVNELVSKMEKQEDGTWLLPEDESKDLDEPTLFAVTSERRRRDTQSGYTKSQQQVRRQTALASVLQEKLLSSSIEFTPEQRNELDSLKTTDPDKWREKLNEYETKARTLLKTELEEIAKNTADKSEIEIREEQMAAWSKSTGIKLTDEIVNNDLPPRFKKDLTDGKITFEKFLEKAGTFLTSKKIIKGSEEDTDDDTINLSDVAGGQAPTKQAQEGDFEETYKKTIF